MQRSSFPRRIALLAAFLPLGALGCARLARSAFQNPVVELRDVQVRGIGLQGGSLDVVLDVYNPNDYRIDVGRVTYTVFADSLKVATGEVTRRVTLDNKATSTVTLPVNFTMRELTQAAGILLQRGSVDYTVQGDFTLATPFGSLTRPYKSRGRYDTLGR
ncbi:MAG: LEA type 2 family protein [Gemmatimonadetes bacterium]|nr:LEA type 2 family protein [Gemmatimonadota bacterium]